jgi:hypothetical protein
MVVVYIICALLMPKAGSSAPIREVEVEKEKTENN